MDEMADVSLLEFVQTSTPYLVDESTLLSEIIARIERDLGLANPQLHSVTIVFGHGMREFYGRMLPDVHADYLTVTDDAGAVRWWVPCGEWNTITFANLLNSQTAGLIDDPREIRIVKTGEFGNGIPPMDWPNFLTVLGHISTVLGLTGLALKGAAAVKKHFGNWRDRRARPEDLVRFVVDRRTWDSSDLGKRLDIPRDDAKAMLDLFGYRFDSDSQLYVRDQRGRSARVRNELKDAFRRYDGE